MLNKHINLITIVNENLNFFKEKCTIYINNNIHSNHNNIIFHKRKK